jgi:MerR family copper efflux transcriptional regulator
VEVHYTASAHIADIRRKIAALKSMERSLSDRVKRCVGDVRPDCPILDEPSADVGVRQGADGQNPSTSV